MPSMPRHAMIKKDLLRRLKDGEWRPGELLPTENGFAREYSVSVGTARKALADLVAENLLIRQRGRGTTVALHKERLTKSRYYRLISENGSFANQDTSYLNVSRGVASVIEASAMEIAEGSDVVRITRCRLLDGKPAVLERLCLREDILPNFANVVAENKPEIFYSFIERHYHVIIRNVLEKVSPCLSTEADDLLLNVAVGQPMLHVERRAFDIQGRCLEYRIMRARSDISYQAEIS